MAFVKDNEGASTIFGIILIVAITVVLAAITAEYVFQISTVLPKQHILGTRIERVSPEIISVRTISGDLDMLKAGGANHHVQAEATYTCIANGIQVFQVTATGDPIPDGTGNFDASIEGCKIYFPANSISDVTVTAHFTDGTSTVIYSGSK